ncbi:hypothetical protein WH221_12540 [Chryseobacterium culicis]|uniref:Uncharacterized protein n=1 Tax=Chryseobacterium culicis TaxID=680127 RepID=A0A2S9D2P4_CHRCI|nr:hypothetical protein [Chryseobacterium culicis]PRB87027.1 hypothetical protein CQ022_12520 [Chryseobacterium culicis]PRB92780.1 hypothetical protein CQ033_06190 [Chryseobacterium culicis]
MKRKLQLSGIFIILLVVFVIGLKGTFDGYYGFYYENKNYEKPLAYSISENIAQSKPVNIFTSYTGFDTGYGFYAPNVASDFVMSFELKDQHGNILEQKNLPHFKNKESRVRYTTVFNMFLDKISDQKSYDSKYYQYLDIIIRQIAAHVMKENPKAASVTTRLYLYDYPTIADFRQGKTNENLILIDEFKH